MPGTGNSAARQLRLLIVVIVAVILVLVLIVGCTTERSGPLLTVSAPPNTDRASVLIEGRTMPQAAVSVANGALPVEAQADANGHFNADVPLRPDSDSQLIVTTRGSRGHADRTIHVRQRNGKPAGSLRGKVVDSTAGTPVADATVRYGTSSATTGPDGSYTLTPVPEGTVVAQARKPGSLTRLAVGTVSGNAGDAGPTFLQTLAPPVTFGPQGASLAGRGWRVDIPAGALPTPTALHITPLLFSGAMDIFGAPLIDLSPAGVHFAKPITVTLNPAAIGLDGENVQIRGLDPETVTTRTLGTTAVNGQLRAEMTDLHGEEIRAHWTEAPRSDPNWCKPFASSSQADAALAYLNFTLIPTLAGGAGRAATEGFLRYLTPGTPTLARYSVSQPEALAEFRDDALTQSFLTRVWIDAQLAVTKTRPPLGPPDNPTTKELRELQSDNNPGKGVGQYLNIHWAGNIWRAPEVLAGGVGATDINGFSVPDERHINGIVRLIPHATDRGVRTSVDLEADNLELQVLDGIDFCIGHPGNVFQYYLFTLYMSRLEKTPHPRGHYTTPTLFEVHVKLDTSPRKVDVTELYPTNDQDKDGVPDAQPWDGASYKLDNCPADPNPDQTDSDSDGAGDACQCPGSPSVRSPVGSCLRTPPATWTGTVSGDTGASKWSAEVTLRRLPQAPTAPKVYDYELESGTISLTADNTSADGCHATGSSGLRPAPTTNTFAYMVEYSDRWEYDISIAYSTTEEYQLTVTCPGKQPYTVDRPMPSKILDTGVDASFNKWKVPPGSKHLTGTYEFLGTTWKWDLRAA